MPPDREVLPRLFTAEQMADLFRIPTDTLSEWIDADLVPHIRCPDGSVLLPLGGFQMAATASGLIDEDGHLAGEIGEPHAS